MVTLTILQDYYYYYSDVSLANPVSLMVTPLTVEQALERNVIDSYELDDSVSPTRASKLELVLF